MDTTEIEFWTLTAYTAVVVAVVAAMLALSHVLGPRRAERTTGEPYEAGMAPTGTARFRFSAQFYLIAVFFVIFDLEAVFIFAWAVAARENGWGGYVEVTVFIVILLAALAYLWRAGALDWAPGDRARRPARR